MQMKHSQSEEYREAILQIMRERNSVELPFGDVYRALREAYTNPLTGKSPVRADNLKNAILSDSSPLDLMEKGKTIVLIDYSRLITSTKESVQ